MTAEMFEDLDMDMNSGDDGSEGDGGENSDPEGDDVGSGGSDVPEAEVPTISKKKKKPKTKKDKKNKMSKEMKELQNKQHSYHGNIYKVQIEELLLEVGVPQKKRTEVETWVKNFTNFVKNLEPSETYSITDYEQFLKPVPIPLPQAVYPKEDTKGTFKWLPPSAIEIVGSWAAGTAVYKICEIDLVLAMPQAYLNKSDYLNHKYHVKRASYLAYIAKHLSEKEDQGKIDQIKFTVQNGNPLKPVLQVDLKNLKIWVHAIPEPGFFKPERFRLDLNNSRYQQFFGKLQSEDEPEYSTPNYNFSILTDLLVTESQSRIHHIISKSSKYREAVQLLKVWLQQRSLSKGFGGFSGFIISAFVAYLSSIEKINSVMSSYEIIRIVFVNLTQLDLTTKGISFSPGANVSHWHLQFDVVFLDISGNVNYTSDMSKLTYKRVQLEAQRALATLDGAKVAGFQALFVTPVPFIQNFDHVFQLFYPNRLIKQMKKKPEYDQQFLNYSGYFYPIGVSTLGQLIEKCLAKRLQLIDCELNPVPEWEIGHLPPNFSLEPLRFGFIIASEAAKKAVEKCESEDHVQSQIFRDFWGDKSQLRRFKDGTMCETVVFEDKYRVCMQMLKYTLKKHLGLDLLQNGTDYLDCQVEQVLEQDYQMAKMLEKPKKTVFLKGKRKQPTLSDLQELVPVTLDEIANKASNSFDELSKTLRMLNGLPLEITSVQGTSSILRFSNVHPTPPQRFYSSKLLTEVHPKRPCFMFKKLEEAELPPKVPKVVEPISVVLHLETSGKWPDDMAAIDHLKCAFLIRIGQLLNDQFNFTVQPHSRHLDVMKDGFVFRITLTYYRELTLLKQQLGVDGVLRLRDNHESLRLEKESLLLPQLTSTLHSFYRQYESFGKTCRLAKRWIASQLLLASPLKYNQNPEQPDCRFTEESVELLVAHLFMYYAPHLSPPNEPQLGFLRFLFLLAHTNWRAMPMILNFHDKLSTEDMSAIELDFVRSRDDLPPLFISTPEDKVGSVWTRDLSPVILSRVQKLATEALRILKETLDRGRIKTDESNAKGLKKQLKIIYSPSTEHFDLKILIKKGMNPRSSQRIQDSNSLQFNEYTPDQNEVMPIVEFDPVQLYLQELRDTFGHLALFLHDNYGGQFIAVIWRPDVFKEHGFSISQVNGRVLDKPGKLTMNVDGVLESFELLGEGIVDRIEKKCKNPVD